jgi:hypothetical protein
VHRWLGDLDDLDQRATGHGNLLARPGWGGVHHMGGDLVEQLGGAPQR